MARKTTDELGIDSEEQFIAQVKETGVTVTGDPETLLYTEGEGRGTRYFMATGTEAEKVAKADIEQVFDDFGGDELVVDIDMGDIECEYCGDEVGFLTGSHMSTHDSGPQTVDEYRQYAADELGIDPGDVPLASEDLMQVFAESGDLDQETRDRLSEMNKARWEAGEYDHLAEDDEEEEEAEAAEATA